MHAAKDELDPPFEILEPEKRRGPVVFNSPHSGSVYPRAFLIASRLDVGDAAPLRGFLRRRAVLWAWSRRGHPLMRAHFPRCYVDVNREPYELDPRMFDGRLPSFANTRSMRVAGGLGTVARVVGDAQEIYGQRLSVDEAFRRIERLYKPYHRALRRLITRVHRDFGAAVLIDCHSMPSTAGAKEERPRADVVLGDRYGTSCAPAVAETIEATLRGAGLFGEPQQALCRRLHHRALRQPGRRPAFHPAGDQPGALYGRAALRALGRRLRSSRPTWRRWRTGWPASRWRNCGPTAPRRNRRAVSGRRQRKGPLANASGPSLGRKRPRRAAVSAGATALQQDATAAHKAQARFCANHGKVIVECKKKGRLRCKRPKSREETPKEGSGSARRYRTANAYRSDPKMQGMLT